MAIISSIHFDKQIVIACGNVTFNHFGNSFQCFSNLIRMIRIFEMKPHKSTGFISDFLRIDDKSGTFKKAKSGKFLYTLVYCRATYFTNTRNFQKRYSRIFCNIMQYSFI